MQLKQQEKCKKCKNRKRNGVSVPSFSQRNNNKPIIFIFNIYYYNAAILFRCRNEKCRHAIIVVTPLLREMPFDAVAAIIVIFQYRHASSIEEKFKVHDAVDWRDEIGI